MERVRYLFGDLLLFGLNSEQLSRSIDRVRDSIHIGNEVLIGVKNDMSLFMEELSPEALLLANLVNEIDQCSLIRYLDP